MCLPNVVAFVVEDLGYNENDGFASEYNLFHTRKLVLNISHLHTGIYSNKTQSFGVR